LTAALGDAGLGVGAAAAAAEGLRLFTAADGSPLLPSAAASLLFCLLPLPLPGTTISLSLGSIAAAAAAAADDDDDGSSSGTCAAAAAALVLGVLDGPVLGLSPAMAVSKPPTANTPVL
jgi:hypothetical protein